MGFTFVIFFTAFGFTIAGTLLGWIFSERLDNYFADQETLSLTSDDEKSTLS
jgi:hypothetical protein